jgi:hypothetical protein
MNRSIGKRITHMVFAAFLVAGMSAAWAAAASFPTPEAAANALVDALKGPDQAALARILGDDWRQYIPTTGLQREDVEAFVDDYAAAHRIVGTGNSRHVGVGQEGWTLPIPIVQKGSSWSFDTRVGHNEIIARQVGYNEISVVQALLAYCDAQHEYATSLHDKDTVPHYAGKLISTPGKHDGLYWPSADNAPESPLGPYFAKPPKGDEYYGYHYRILTAQGPSAPGGAYNYLVNGVPANGFALIAWPARYGESGVMTFAVSHDGQVFEKDLGKGTPSAVTRIQRFDPDSSWKEVPATL